MSSKKTQSTYGKKSQSQKERFDVLAKEKGWTEEQLRRSYDLPKTPLPPGVPLIKHNWDLTEDPFKDAPRQDPQQEFDIAEERFYEKLKRITLVKADDQKGQTSGTSSPRKSRSRSGEHGKQRSKGGEEKEKSGGSSSSKSRERSG